MGAGPPWSWSWSVSLGWEVLGEGALVIMPCRSSCGQQCGHLPGGG